MYMLLIFLLLPFFVDGIDFRPQMHRPDAAAAESSYMNPYIQFTQPPPPTAQTVQSSNGYSNPMNYYPVTNRKPAYPISDLIQPDFSFVQQERPQSKPITQAFPTPPAFYPSSSYSQTHSHQTLVNSFVPDTTTTTKRPKTTTMRPSVTPLIWTTTKAATSKTPVKMSKLSSKSTVRKEESGAAQISVPSHRLLNDILVIPSSRRLYILAILPIHESIDSQGFECGRVDVNGFIHLAAFLEALNQVNSESVLKDAGLSLGAVVVDSCTSDLRTVADLYELLSGTNIQKNDLVAMVRDDRSHLPNVDDFAKHLKIPVINTFFSTREKPLTTGVLPLMSSALDTMVGLLKHTKSTCVSLMFDELYEEAADLLDEFSVSHDICIEQKLNLRSGGKSVMDSAVRRMLLTESRVVIVLLGEHNWFQLMKAFRSEMVIAGRFILLTTQDARWFTSSRIQEEWNHFDQLLLTVTQEKVHQISQLIRLTTNFPKYPFPQHWIKQFWATAFKCHVEGDTTNMQHFSKECADAQSLNLTTVSPDLDVAPVTLAVHTIGHAVRRLVDNVCPGALVQTLNDCLNDPQEALFAAILALRFPHTLADTGDVYFNETSGYRDQTIVLNRVMYDTQLEFEKLAEWNSVSGFSYTSPFELVMEERGGERLPLRSTCPRSTCASAMAHRTASGVKPSFRQSLNSSFLLVYTVGAVIGFFICLMCMYHQIVASNLEPYRICTVFSIGGLSLLCLVSILFIMSPNTISCVGRRISFSIAICTVFAPIFIKTIAVWRSQMSSSKPHQPNQKILATVIIGIIIMQAVIVSEWMLFESATDLVFTSSSRHGYEWRCAPGEQFEYRLLNSCALSGFMLMVSLVCSVLSVSHVESRRTIILTVLAGLYSIGLYVSLPLLPFTIRDQVIAGVLVSFSFLSLLTIYCPSGLVQSGNSSRSSDQFTLNRNEKNSQWLDNHVLSPRLQVNTDPNNYHLAGTMPQMNTIERMERYGYAAPPIPSTLQRYASSQSISTAQYNMLPRPQMNPQGVSMTMPRPVAIPQPPLGHNYNTYNGDRSTASIYNHVPPQLELSSGKYGKEEYVLEEEEGGHSRL